MVGCGVGGFVYNEETSSICLPSLDLRPCQGGLITNMSSFARRHANYCPWHQFICYLTLMMYGEILFSIMCAKNFDSKCLLG